MKGAGSNDLGMNERSSFYMELPSSSAVARNNVLLLCLQLAECVVVKVQSIRNNLFGGGCNPLAKGNIYKSSANCCVTTGQQLIPVNIEA